MKEPLAAESVSHHDSSSGLCPDQDKPLRVILVSPLWVRILLVVMAVGFIGVFTIAIWLNPYRENGQARQWETHRQMGLPPCSFKMVTDLPCPSCGMTTSFSLLIRGDVWNSVKANFVGTFLATVLLLYIPWAFVCAFLGRPVGIICIELWLCRLVIVFVVVMLLRWGIVLLLTL